MRRKQSEAIFIHSLTHSPLSVFKIQRNDVSSASAYSITGRCLCVLHTLKHHYIIFFVRPLHSKPWKQNYCWCVFSQLKPSELDPFHSWECRVPQALSYMTYTGIPLRGRIVCSGTYKKRVSDLLWKSFENKIKCKYVKGTAWEEPFSIFFQFCKFNLYEAIYPTDLD